MRCTWDCGKISLSNSPHIPCPYCNHNWDVTMKKIKVVLVDDHTVVREGLRALLANEPDIEVIGEAPDGRRALALVKQCQPDVVVMDVAMPLLNGMDATRQILRISRSTGVL